MAKDKQKQLLTEVMNADAKDGLYKQQTAVDFIVEWLANIDWDDPHFRNILQEAKQMEKEQITDAYNIGKVEANFPPEMLTNGEKFYKERYGN